MPIEAGLDLRGMQPSRGFTLLEMLVVMVLLGLVTTMALPAMQRWHDAVQTRSQLAGLTDALRSAGFRAGALQRQQLVDLSSFEPPRTEGQPASAPIVARNNPTSTVEYAATSLAENDVERVSLNLPARWKIVAVDKIRFLPNGLCQPGGLRLLNDRGDPVNIRVSGPLCSVEAEEGGDSRPP